jgi:hypothetical protein
MNEERSHIDPEGRYPSDGLRRVEKNALRVLDLLPGVIEGRTRDCIQINFGDEDGIVILVTAEAIEIRLPTVEWTMGSYGPAASSRLWKRVECCEIDDAELISLLNDALKQRKSEFKICRYCGRKFPPEHMHASDVCQGCATKHLGVVY